MDLDRVAADLYALPPGRFTTARNARAAEIRAAGDVDLAAVIKKLAKPTVSAWLANLLVRKKRWEVEQLLALGPSLRDAQTRLAGDDLRQLARQRQELVAALVQWAKKLAKQEGERVSDSALDELHDTLQGALGDARVSEALLSGRLTKAVQSGGLGGLDVEIRGEPSPGARKTASPSVKGGDAKKVAVELDKARRERTATEREVDRLEKRLRALEEQVAQVREEARIARDRLRRAKREEEVVQRKARTK